MGNKKMKWTFINEKLDCNMIRDGHRRINEERQD